MTGCARWRCARASHCWSIWLKRSGRSDAMRLRPCCGRKVPRTVVRARLRRLLHRLQLALGDVIASDRSTVRLSAETALNINSQLFEQACDDGEFERACALYQADFLDGFSPGDCPQFDEWAFFRREALRGRAIQALERVVQEKNVAGDYASAAAHATPSGGARSAQRNLCPPPHPQSSPEWRSGRGRAPARSADTTFARRARRGARSRDERAARGWRRRAAADAIRQRRQRASCVPDLWQREHRRSDAARLRVPCRTGLGGRKMPRLSFLACGDGPPHPARSPWRRPVGPGRVQPQRGGNRAGHPHRARCRRITPGRAVRRIRRRTGLHPVRRRSSRPCRRPDPVRFAREGKCCSRLSACVAGRSVSMRGCSSSLRPGAGLPGSRRSRRVSPAMPRRERGGPACFVQPQARARSGACWRPCAIRMCGIFSDGSPFRRWCSTAAATAPCASAPGDISPSTFRRRGSSSSTVPITGLLPAISRRCSISVRQFVGDLAR